MQEDYEAALKELNEQLLRGMSIDEIRPSLKNHDIKITSNAQEIQRHGNNIVSYHKKYDVSQWLTKKPSGHMKEVSFYRSSVEALIEKTFGAANIIMRQLYNIGNDELVVSTVKSHIAS